MLQFCCYCSRARNSRSNVCWMDMKVCIVFVVRHSKVKRAVCRGCCVFLFLGCFNIDIFPRRLWSIYMQLSGTHTFRTKPFRAKPFRHYGLQTIRGKYVQKWQEILRRVEHSQSFTDLISYIFAHPLLRTPKFHHSFSVSKTFGMLMISIPHLESHSFIISPALCFRDCSQ